MIAILNSHACGGESFARRLRALKATLADHGGPKASAESGGAWMSL